MHGVLKMVNFKIFFKNLIAGYENFRIINLKEKKYEYYHERCSYKIFNHKTT